MGMLRGWCEAMRGAQTAVERSERQLAARAAMAVANTGKGLETATVQTMLRLDLAENGASRRLPLWRARGHARHERCVHGHAF